MTFNNNLQIREQKLLLDPLLSEATTSQNSNNLAYLPVNSIDSVDHLLVCGEDSDISRLTSINLANIKVVNSCIDLESEKCISNPHNSEGDLVKNFDQEFQCEVCHKKFKSSYSLKSHHKVHIEKRDYICKTCGNSFKRKSGLIQHQLVHNPNKKYACLICNKNFKRQYHLKCHSETHKDLNIECLFCGRVFHQQKVYIKHKKIHDKKGKNFSCTHCNFMCKTLPEFNEHKKIHSQTHKALECDICGKKFKYNYYLVEHLKSHSSSKDYKCQICEKLFKFKRSLEKHTTKHNLFVSNKMKKHVISQVSLKRNYECKFCHRNIKCLRAYNAHLKMHEQGKNYCCTSCKLMFSTNKELRFHELCHSDNKTFQCDVEQCLKVFLSFNALNKHSKKHLASNKNKIHQCCYCGKILTTAYKLKLHEKRHTETEKHFQCEECGKCFLSKPYLWEHQQIHKNKYKCCKCSKAFRITSELTRHEKEVHSNGGGISM